MPYRDPPLASPGPPRPALRVAALLVGVQAIASLVLSLARYCVGKAAEAEVGSNAVAFEHGRYPYDEYWASVAKSPFWTFAPWTFVALVLIANVLVALRGRADTRWHGVFGAALGCVSVVLLAAPILLAGPADPILAVGAAVLFLAALPVLWAVSAPGARLFVWLATAAGFANAFVALAPPRSFHAGERMSASVLTLSGATLAHGESVSFLLSLVGFVTVAVAALVQRPEDGRGPAPASPMAGAATAMLLATVPPCGLAVFRGAVAWWDSSSTRPGCIAELQQQARMSDFRFVLDRFTGFAIVGTIAVFVAARALAPRLVVVVGVVAAVQRGLGFLVMAQSPTLPPAWAACACAVVVVATVLVHAAQLRTLEDASRLAPADGSTVADQALRTTRALVACSLPAIGAALVVAVVDRMETPSLGLACGGGFLGLATCVLGWRAAHAYRRGAFAFSELARASVRPPG